MKPGGIDLLGDDLVHVEQDASPVETAWGPIQALEPVPSPTGPCNVCRERPAQHRCLHCELAVCREHYWIMLGLCKACATDAEAKAAREGLGRRRPDLDIKWIEDR